MHLVRPALHAALRAAAVAAAVLALASPAGADCPGCEPSVESARTIVERTLKAAFLSPFTLVSFEKLDGRGLETQGRKVYEMRIRAVVNYQGISLRCRRKFCPELHHYIMDVDAAAKTATVASWLFFEEDGSGWRLFAPNPGPQ
jgi:hypothetical protein